MDRLALDYLGHITDPSGKRLAKDILVNFEKELGRGYNDMAVKEFMKVLPKLVKSVGQDMKYAKPLLSVLKKFA